MAMQNQPLVSVIMAVYNGEQYLKEALNSVLQQTLANFEFIIVDDGSSDSSLNIIKACKDSRIKLICNEKNLGLPASLNKAIKHSSGKYLARMDADDVCYPDRFQLQFDYMEQHPEVDLLFSSAQKVDDNDQALDDWKHEKATITDQQIKAYLLQGNCLYHPTAFIKRDCYLKQPYDERIGNAEDYELWLRLSLLGYTFAKLPHKLLNYRVHNASMTASRAKDRLGKLKQSLWLRKLACENIEKTSGKKHWPLRRKILTYQFRIFRHKLRNGAKN